MFQPVENDFILFNSTAKELYKESVRKSNSEKDDRRNIFGDSGQVEEIVRYDAYGDVVKLEAEAEVEVEVMQDWREDEKDNGEGKEYGGEGVKEEEIGR